MDLTKFTFLTELKIFNVFVYAHVCVHTCAYTHRYVYVSICLRDLKNMNL